MVVIFYSVFGDEFFGFLFDEITALLDYIETFTKVLNKIRIRLYQLWNDEVSDFVSEIIIFFVRNILTERHRIFLRKIIDFFLCESQKRAQDLVFVCWDAAQSFQTASTHQVDEKCFQLVIQMVGSRYKIYVVFFTDLMKKMVSQLSRP